MFNRIRKDTEITTLSGASSTPGNQIIFHSRSNLSDLEATPNPRPSLTPQTSINGSQSTTSQFDLSLPTGTTTRVTPTIKIDNPPSVADTPSLKIVFRRAGVKEEDIMKKLEALRKELTEKKCSEQAIQTAIEKQYNHYYSEYSVYKVEKKSNTIVPLSETGNPQTLITELIAEGKGETNTKRKHLEVHGLRQIAPSSRLGPTEHKKIPKIISSSHVPFQFNAGTKFCPKGLPEKKDYTFITIRFKTTASRPTGPLQKLSNTLESVFNTSEPSQNPPEKPYPGTHEFYGLCDERGKKIYLFPEKNEITQHLLNDLATLSNAPLFT